MSRGRWPSVNHRCWVVGDYLCVFQLAGRGGEMNIPRTVVPEHSNASKWFSHCVNIEVGGGN